MRASPVGQPPSARHAAKSSGPAARWIAPSTPPPPRRVVFAALTIASTSCLVMSPSTSSIRPLIGSPLEIGRPPMIGWRGVAGEAASDGLRRALGRRMLRGVKNYARASSLEEAVRFLADRDGSVDLLAGGTDLLLVDKGYD